MCPKRIGVDYKYIHVKNEAPLSNILYRIHRRTPEDLNASYTRYIRAKRAIAWLDKLNLNSNADLKGII